MDVKEKNLFLHVCCGPCSTSVLKRLYGEYNIYIIFYNSNIDTKDEFIKRLNELNKVIILKKYVTKIIYSDYNHDEYLDYVKGFEGCKEGGDRCTLCYKLRLSHSLNIAENYIKINNLTNNYLCTTLSVSPYKNAKKLNEIGVELCKNKNIKYLISDFKKQDGYLDSIIISKELGLYRQEYCGCEFAK